MYFQVHNLIYSVKSYDLNRIQGKDNSDTLNNKYIIFNFIINYVYDHDGKKALFVVKEEKFDALRIKHFNKGCHPSGPNRMT
jgi:hypothetical protein